MKLLVAIFVLWLPFSLLALAAIPIALLAIVFDEMPYGKDVIRAMDKLGAAVLGFDGHRTISAECGARDCKLCSWLCALLDRVDPGHCAKAAEKGR